MFDPAKGRDPWYSERRWERFAPLTGILAVAVWIIGVILVESDSPDEDAGAQTLTAHFEENTGELLAGGFLFMLGSAIFLWFLGSVRTRLLASEGPAGRLTAIFFAAGVATAVLSAASQAPTVGGAIAADETDRPIEPGAAEAFWGLGDGFFVAAETMVAIFFLAAALTILRTRAFPAWLGLVSLAFGVIAFFPWVGWAALVWGLPLWVLIVSIWMFIRPTGRAEAA